MSFRNSILNDLSASLDNNMAAFFKAVHDRYSVPVNELQELWSNVSNNIVTNTVPSTTQADSELSEAYLLSCSTVTLKSICKSRGVKKYSKLKKIDLISLLLNKEVQDIKPVKKSPKKKKNKKQTVLPNVIKYCNTKT